MKVVYTDGLDASVLGRLHTALEGAEFAEACCVGSLDTAQVYLRCPHAMHGVLFNVTPPVSDRHIQWAVEALRGSVDLGDRGSATNESQA